MPKSSTKKSGRAVGDLSYEEAVTELEDIIESLEDGQNALDDSMKLFERGQALAARCSELLEDAQLKVQKLSGDQVTTFEEGPE